MRRALATQDLNHTTDKFQYRPLTYSSWRLFAFFASLRKIKWREISRLKGSKFPAACAPRTLALSSSPSSTQAPPPSPDRHAPPRFHTPLFIAPPTLASAFPTVHPQQIPSLLSFILSGIALRTRPNLRVLLQTVGIMATPKQIETSRITRRRTKGPVSPQGKLNSSGNRLRHGLLAQTVVLEGESGKVSTHCWNTTRRPTSLNLQSSPRLIETTTVATWRLPDQLPSVRCSPTPSATLGNRNPSREDSQNEKIPVPLDPRKSLKPKHDKNSVWENVQKTRTVSEPRQ